jgi:hypothetical protein
VKRDGLSGGESPSCVVLGSTRRASQARIHSCLPRIYLAFDHES